MEEWSSKTQNIENMSMLSYINEYGYILRSVKMFVVYSIFCLRKQKSDIAYAIMQIFQYYLILL